MNVTIRSTAALYGGFVCYFISEASLSVKEFETGFLAQTYLAIRTSPN